MNQHSEQVKEAAKDVAENIALAVYREGVNIRLAIDVTGEKLVVIATKHHEGVTYEDCSIIEI